MRLLSCSSRVIRNAAPVSRGGNRLSFIGILKARFSAGWQSVHGAAAEAQFTGLRFVRIAAADPALPEPTIAARALEEGQQCAASTCVEAPLPQVWSSGVARLRHICGALTGPPHPAIVSTSLLHKRLQRRYARETWRAHAVAPTVLKPGVHQGMRSRLFSCAGRTLRGCNW